MSTVFFFLTNASLLGILHRFGVEICSVRLPSSRMAQFVAEFHSCLPIGRNVLLIQWKAIHHFFRCSGSFICYCMYYQYWQFYSKIIWPIWEPVNNVPLVYCDQATCGSLRTTAVGVYIYLGCCFSLHVQYTRSLTGRQKGRRFVTGRDDAQPTKNGRNECINIPRSKTITP